MSMSSTPTTFAGTSKYSSDLQQVLSRAVAIASLPLTQLNSQLSTLQSRSSAIDTLNTNFTAIQTALGKLGSGSSSSATVSDPTIVSAHTDPATLPGTYTLNVIDPGSPSTTLSLDGLTTVTDPSSQSITTATSLSLTVNGASFTIAPADNSLISLAAAINSAGAGVSATIINIGSPLAPDYRLSLQSGALGNIPIQLNDGSSDLLQTLVAGTAAQYQVNGQPSIPISSSARTIIVAPGLTADLLKAGTTSIVVSQTSSAMGDALTSFIAAYNAAVDSINLNHGKSGGALTGDPILSTLSQALRNVSGYSSGSGAVQSLADLGVALDRNGKLSLNQQQLDSVMSAHPSEVSAFLGSATTSGFLKISADVMNNLEDPIDGVLPALQTSMQQQITAQNQSISDMQDRIDLMQANLTARISAADALIASLEQQVSYFTTLFQISFNNGNKNN